MLKINTTSKYAELKFDNKSDLYPLNEISYTVENESETVSFYNRFYHKIVTEQISNIQVNDVPVTRANIQDLLSVLFAGYEGGGGSVDLSNYYTKPETNTLLDTKVDKVEGKQLSTEDYTTAEKTKLAGLENYDDTVVKADIAANTAAIETEVTRAKAAEKVNADAIAAVDTVFKAADVVLQGNIGAEVTRATAAETVLDGKIDTKVDKVEGKQLSTEDFTTDFKTKLENLENYDDSDINSSLSAEVTRAKAAEKVNADAITAVDTAYKVADVTLQDNIDTEVTRAKAAEKINTDAIIAEAERAKAAEQVLDTKIDTKADKDVLFSVSSNVNTLQLTNKRIQHTTITGNTSVIFPTVGEYAEIHLIFDAVTDNTITFPANVVWKEIPAEMVEGEIYEFIFTYLNNVNKWIAGYIKYE